MTVTITGDRRAGVDLLLTVAARDLAAGKTVLYETASWPAAAAAQKQLAARVQPGVTRTTLTKGHCGIRHVSGGRAMFRSSHARDRILAGVDTHVIDDDGTAQPVPGAHVYRTV